MSNESNGTKVSDFMKLMDVVDIQRRQDSAVMSQLSIGDQKKRVAGQLRETYEKMGVKVTDDQIEHAIEDHYNRKWEFEAPADNFGTTLANWYADRRRITLTRILPVVALAAVGTTLTWATSSIRDASIRREEHNVESSVEKMFNSRKENEKELSIILESPVYNSLPESEKKEAQLNLSSAGITLKSTDQFFSQFCPDGKARDAVTKENYKEVAEKLQSLISASLEDADSDIDSARGILNTQVEYNSLESILDNTIAELKNFQPPRPFVERGETHYNNGISSIGNRQIEQARKHSSALVDIVRESKEFEQVLGKTESTYSSAKSIVAEDLARTEVDRVYAKAKDFATKADTQNLKVASTELQNLDSTLRQEYKIEVLSKPGMLTAVWRESNDNPSRNSNDEDPQGKMFYLVVQAVTPQGKILSMPLRNIEDGSMDTVTIWGERIPHEVYMRIKKDKKDNELLDSSATPGFNNLYFAEKKVGYLNLTQIMTDNRGMPLKREGQLTREDKDNNWRRR